ncbi:hypothetical protein PR048_027226 [Dryococelus australis]|uniref:HAT C-terminal dimerisation domain-containing protein n=1 Tax=Dryococelus australis TaxID=614101 RepID=A0ABQ9GEV5_9NEOP|nr:hypothetical protein PR048_027226 [Dryococelus australis]
MTIFVPCSTHSLNLVATDAALACNEAVTFFDIVLEEHVSDLTVKPLSETLWESCINALTPFRYQIGEIYYALYELSVDPRTDAFGKNTALSLARKLKMWYAILFRINVVSKVLQRENMDISTASDKGFEETMVDSKETAETLDIEPQFPAELPVGPRKIKRQFDYESHVEVDPKNAFKRNFFSTHWTENDGLLQKRKYLQLVLTYEGHRDVDGTQLHQELMVLRSLCDAPKSLNGPLEVLKYIFTNNLCENFSNLTVALRILLTLPVTVASGERSFSK